jgi:hypothetical protein
MKNMEKEKFEESFKSAFDKAEISPSGNVWTKIELELEKEKGGHLKRRLFFYQMLAAASVVVGMTIAGVGYYYSFNQNQNNRPLLAQEQNYAAPTLSQQPDVTPGATNESAIAPNTDDSNSIKKGFDSDSSTPDASRLPSEVPDRQSSLRVNGGNAQPEKTSELASFIEADVDRYPELPSQVEDANLPALFTPRDVKLDVTKNQPQVDPVQQMLANLERREREVQGEEKTKTKDLSENESLWTSIGFAAGSFNAMQASAPSSPSRMDASVLALAAPIVDQESKASGYSYSMGVNVGTKISQRWVLQGGVNYLTHSAEFTANNVVMDGLGRSHSQQYKPATTNAVVNSEGNDLSNKIVYTAPYNVNNSMRYLSIPMQAGYLVVDKTFGVQLNAGVSTDLFLQNTVSGQSDQLAKTSQGGGADSPYRTVNLSGLFGTEVSYRFGPHYRVSLNPGIRYPFNTIYKSELGVQSSPLTFDVGLRFRYIFH